MLILAESKIKASNITEVINTGITGVTTIKTGKTVTLRLSRTSQTYTAGWNTLGELPDVLKPYLAVNFTCIDNSIARYSDANVFKCEIGQDGKLNVFIPSDKTTAVLLATVTYTTFV